MLYYSFPWRLAPLPFQRAALYLTTLPVSRDYKHPCTPNLPTKTIPTKIA